MRVVSWNMAHKKRAWDYFRELDPDLALLQEVNVPAAPSWLHERWPDQVMWPLASWRWGSAILAKPSLRLTAYPGEPRGMEIEGWIATGFVALPGGGTALVGSVHAPPFTVPPAHLAGFDLAAIKLPRYRVPRTYDVAYATYRERVGDTPFIIGGDWNISPDLWLELHPNSHSVDFFNRASADGWVDCYRRDHEQEGQTWYRGGDLPYQFDHVFCDEKTARALRSCDIDSYPAADLRVSDHAPLVLDFDSDAVRP